MDEDGVVKAAPVTRLRRRMSVEAEETKSPSAPATPTKKRPTRLAAKPQLELIDEHAVTSSPKRTTRKSISRDKVEPEENPVTPARRSTRAKSNTSLVSEAEEKPLTPARRSTRIKSNTSLVSETSQSVESPRAKRAVARRNSQVGSDNETPVTPARARRTRKSSTSSIDKDETPSVTETAAVTPGRTRRSRKGSTSSIDAAEAALAEKPSLITEVIIEEPESKHRKSTSDKDNVDNKDSPARKSPRLKDKKSRKSKSEDTNEIQKQTQEQDEQNDNIPTSTTDQPEENKQNNIECNISLSSANLIKDLDIFGKMQKKISSKNKSMSDIEDTSESKKRNRTKSWTTLCASSSPIESNFYSDNESKKKKLKRNGKIVNEKRHGYGDDTGSGDGVNQTVAAQKKDEELISNTSKKNRKSRNSSISNKSEDIDKSDEEVSSSTSGKNKKSRNSSISNKSENIDRSVREATKDVDISNESNKENLDLALVSKNTSKLFENAPSELAKPLVFFEDSDSNSGIVSKEVKQIYSEDQCVPIIVQQSENQSNCSETQSNIIFAVNHMDDKKTFNGSVEPMDIDETMPENISLTAFADEGEQSRKSSLCIPQVNSDSKDTLNKSRKKSLPHSPSQIFYDSKSDEVQNKKTRKSSANVATDINSEECNPERKSSISDDKTEIKNKSIPAENLNVSKDKSMSEKKFQISSIMVAQESDNNLVENLNKSKRKSTSISEENLVNDSSIYNKNNEEIHDKLELKSSISTVEDSDNHKEINTSKRKSLSNSMTHEKTGNEDKSTLKLSQIKDVSAAENSVSGSPPKSDDLSKSINIEETSKDLLVNKKITLNYLTSTPVQQKSIEKVAMQMNTSVITPTNTNKKDFKLSKNKAKRNVSVVSKSSSNESSDEDSENSEKEDSSQDKSNLFEEEAEDAGEDYESGDSQNEDEKQFERENEIIDKGETLTSDEEVSDDSDYEKDSFVVSSDEEDNELLSGSGDDLNLSDNELTLSAKSKKKYNERKLKEQKKASKEMFEARHGVNAKDFKSKKNSRSRLDSSLLKSDEDILPPKKNKRMRLESTLEYSQSDTGDVNSYANTASDKDEIGYKKKKSKRLSESVCIDSENEKEITIYNQGKIHIDDPLSLQIKTEPKTPQKDLEISKVQITDDVEHICVDESKSIMKLNDTHDPLQATIVEKEIESNDDSISENEEITNNYNLVLKELNKESKKQIKSHDVSLNLIKKDKQKKEKTIIDELNITQTNVSKKDNSLLAKEKSVKRVFKKIADTDESSDSIDLKLLFSDDSNGTYKNNDNKKNDSESPEAKDSFISLKKAKAKTNIHQYAGENDDEGLNFFIDTKGDLEDNATTGTDAAVNEADSDDAPVEVLYISEKKKNNRSLKKTPTSERKKKIISESQESISQEQNIFVDKSPASKKTNMGSHDIENQILNAPTSEKKKKMLLSQETESVYKTPASEKKKNKISVSLESNAKSENSGQEDNMNYPRKRKRKQSANKTTDDIETEKDMVQVANSYNQLGESILGSIKKKLKISNSIDENQIQNNISVIKNSEKEQTTFKISKNNIVENQQAVEISEPETKIRKKRKERDDDKNGNVSKVFKENSFDKVHVPRLPPTIIEQLGKLPSEGLHKNKKTKAVATSNFIVEETIKRKNKPSDFMEETICLNDDNSTAVKKKSNAKKPKVLPFLPTVSTSDSGFTTNFHVNVISQKMEFVAQRDEVPNFKNDYLSNKRIKKMRTYDLYKKQRNMKLSKY